MREVRAAVCAKRSRRGEGIGEGKTERLTRILRKYGVGVTTTSLLSYSLTPRGRRPPWVAARRTPWGPPQPHSVPPGEARGRTARS